MPYFRAQSLLLAWLMLVVSAGQARADGLIRDGVGAISSGRGGTNLGFADNGAVLLDNPGALVNVEGCGLWELGLGTVICDLQYTDADPNDIRNDTEGYPCPDFTYIRKSSDGLMAWGIGGYGVAGFGANFEMQNSIIGPSLYKSFGALGKILPAVSYQVTEDLSIGASIGLAVTHVELEGPFILQTGLFAGAPTQFDLQSTGATPTGSAGLQYRLGPSTTLGLAYSEESRFSMDGSVNATVFGMGPPLDSRFDAEVDLVWPRSLGLGLKHDICAHRRVAADVIWYDWSHAFDQLEIKLTNPTNPAFAPFGEIRDSFPMRWKDSVSFRFGYEWEPTACETWRVGYVYHDSPVPDETLNPYLDGVLEHTFSLGYGRQYCGWALNLAYQYMFGPERHVADSDILGGDFDNSTFEAQAHWVSFGILKPF